MKSAVETLGPTRVRLTVEVPFEELKPSVDSAYRKIAQQVRVRGFRPGKVPPRILDQQVGRGTILQEAVNDALPQLYGDAVRETEVKVLGHPEIEITEFADGVELKFTAEVDVRPEVEVPDYDGLPVTVDDAEVTDEEVDEQVSGLRERFAVLKGVERPAAQGDYVMVDLSATVDGKEVEDATATGLSYEVGSGTLIDGLDDALVGMAASDTKAFGTELKHGAYAGKNAEVSVTLRSVKEKELPALDDDFAQTASEFDTIEELRADVRSRLERVKKLQQGMQARDRALEALLGRVEVPIPEHLLGDEVAWRQQNLQQQLESAGLTKEQYVEVEGKTVEDFDREIEDGAREAIKTQFVLEAIAEKEQVGVSETELTDAIVRQAQRAGVPADQLARQIVQSGRLGSVMSEVVRDKALALVLGAAKITDASGREVDLEALNQSPAIAGPGELEGEEAAEAEPAGEPAEAEPTEG